MHLGRNVQVLWVSGHSPAGHQDHNARDEIASWTAGAVSRQPDADEARGPPDYTHAGVLQVVLDPRATPAVLGECVDAAPKADHKTVPELLTSSRASKERLPVKQEDGENDSIGDEGGAHDEVRQTLA